LLKFAQNRREKRQCLSPAFFFVLGKAAKAQETQSYQRFQHIGRTVFNTSGTNAATLVSKGCGGYTLTFANRIAHSGSQGETGAFQRRVQRACGTAMRSCASLFRGVAAPLGCVICLQLGDVTVFSLCAQYFLNVRGGGGITTPGVLCVLPKRRTSACQSGSFVVF